MTARRPHGQTAKGRNPTVAFIDDDERVLDAIRRLPRLRTFSWDLLFYTDPLAALQDSRILACDVVISDLSMPGMDGLELMKALRAKGLLAEVIFLTGTGHMDAAVQAINDIKAFRFYLKPCPQDQLVDGIAEAIALRQSRRSSAELLPFAVFALDGDKHLTCRNSEAQQLLDRGHIISQDAAGHCRANSVAATAALHGAIQSAITTGEATVLGISGTNDAPRHSILVEPAPADGSGAAVLLCVMDPQTRRPPSAEALKQLFQLSNSESKLAHGLALGMDIREVAESMDITVQTARTYLKSLFDKTATNRQADLVRTLITAVPQVRGAP